MRSLRAWAGPFAVVLGLAVLSCDSGGDAVGRADGISGLRPVELTLATVPGGAEGLGPVLRRVRELSQGSLRITVDTGRRRAASDAESLLVQHVKDGKADLGFVGSAAFVSIGVLSLRALTAPMLITSLAAQERVLGDAVGRRMLRGVDGDGITGIGLVPGALRRPAGSGPPLRGPADFAGRRFGVQPSEVAEATIRALGAEPVRFTHDEDVRDLTGFELQLGSVDGKGYGEHGVRTTADLVLWPRPMVLFAGAEAYRGLSPRHRDVLSRAVRDALHDTGRELRGRELAATACLCRRGHRFVTAGPRARDALRRAVQPVYDDLARDPRTRAYLTAVATLVGGIPPETAAVCAGVPRLGAADEDP